jgi:hypothetical protein
MAYRSPAPPRIDLPRDVARCEGLDCAFRDTCARFTQLRKDRLYQHQDWIGAAVITNCAPGEHPASAPAGFIRDEHELHLLQIAADAALRRLRSRKPPTLRQHLRGSR